MDSDKDAVQYLGTEYGVRSKSMEHGGHTPFKVPRVQETLRFNPTHYT